MIQPKLSAGLNHGQTAGAIFKQHPEKGKDTQFLGSVVVYAAGIVEEVRDIISKDIYATSGVWDLGKFRHSQQVTIPGHPMHGNFKVIRIVIHT